MEEKIVRKIVIKRESNHISAITFLALVGTLFAGYLTYSKLFGAVCPLAEGCSYLWGLPTCVYGFVIFLILFLMGFASMVTRAHFRKAISFFSVVGVLFSGYFSIYDLFLAPLNILNGAVYSLILPSCVYGLVLFLVIWILD